MVLFQKKPIPGEVPALFLHIQKTAGTSIVHVARQYYGQNISSHGDCWGKAPEQLSHIGFISGHVGYNFIRPLMQKRYTFTFLRDPAERILSMYYFCKARDPSEFDIYQKAHEMDLSSFLAAGLSDPCVRMNIWNNQVWQLAHGYASPDGRTAEDFSEIELLHLAKTHLGEFSSVGFTESFASDSVRILKALGLPVIAEVPKMNATPGRPCAAEQSTAVRKLLSCLTELDRQLYEHALNELSTSGRAKHPGWWPW